MRTVVPKVVCQAVVIGVSFVSAIFCQTKIDQEFGITGPGTGTNVLAGIYTDPYQGNFGATPIAGTQGTQVVAGTGTPIAAFCDDFTNDVTPPQFWTANDTNLDAFSDSSSTVPGSGVSSVYYGDYSPTLLTATQQTTDYIAVAMLAVESMQAATDTGAFAGLSAQQRLTDQEQISFALWDIFDPSVLSSDCPSIYGCLDSGGGTTNWSAATNYANQALTAAATYTTGAAYENSVHMDVEIYSAASASGAVETGSGRPQEFVTVEASGTNYAPTPEPSMLAFLGFDVVGVGIIGLYFRRRQLGSRS